MKVLFTALPGYGHICPLLPLACALQSRGHDVRFATSITAAEALANVGLRLSAVGPAWHESTLFNAVESRTESGRALEAYISSEVVPQTLHDISDLVRYSSPDIIVSNEYERVGRAIAERRALPFVQVSSGPRLPPALWQRVSAGLFRAARELAGLPPNISEDYSSQWLNLHMMPPSYSIGEVPPARCDVFIRPEISDLFGDADIDWSPADDDRWPLVLCTFGTVFNRNPAQLRTLVEAAAGQPYRLLLVSGPGGVDAQSLSTPDNVRIVCSFSMARWAGRIDAVITHGGASSLVGFMRHGVPLLLWPQGADHGVNALACTRLGLGITLSASMADAVSVASIRSALARLLHDPAYRKNCSAFRGQMLRLPDISHAVTQMEYLVS